MATIREELVLVDKFSKVLKNYITGQEKASKETNRAKSALDKFRSASIVSSKGVSSLTSAVTRLAGAYLSIQGLRNVLNLSDTLSQTTARLDMMNDGLQTTAELTDMIYAAAQRSRGSFTATADMVGKLGNLAGDAFSSTQELVAFSEQLNKQIALSGASAQAADAAILQLTQGLSSGALRGEELNSVLEQTPTVAKTIADYLGMSTGEMREFASEGKLSADIVKNALLSAAEETNAAFAQMPVTWGQAAQQLQNVFVMSLQPALQQLNDFLNSQTGQWFFYQLATAAQAFGTVLSWVIGLVWSFANFIAANMNTILLMASFALLAAAVYAGMFAANMLVAAGASMVANAPLLLMIGIVGILTGILVAFGVTAADVFSAIGGAAAWLYVLVYNLIADVWNVIATFAEFFANVFNNPVRAVAQLFSGVFGAIMGIVENVASAIDALLGTNMAAAISGFTDWVQAGVDELVGENKIKVERMDHLDYGSVMSEWSGIGEGIANSLTNMNVDSMLDGLLGGGSELTTPSVGGAGVGGTVGGIGDSVGGSLGSDVGAIKKEVAMSEEDLKSLVDMAERKYVNEINLNAQTPVITVNGQNTGNTKEDRKALANAIRDILVEQASSASFKSTARTV
ncbi:MAG: tape measure protein [Acutalibacter sp.]